MKITFSNESIFFVNISTKSKFDLTLTTIKTIYNWRRDEAAKKCPLNIAKGIFRTQSIFFWPLTIFLQESSITDVRLSFK